MRSKTQSCVAGGAGTAGWAGNATRNNECAGRCNTKYNGRVNALVGVHSNTKYNG